MASRVRGNRTGRSSRSQLRRIPKRLPSDRFGVPGGKSTGKRRPSMRGRFSGLLITAAVTATAASAVISNVDRSRVGAGRGRASGAAPALKDTLGRTRSAGHLDRRNADIAAAPRPLCQPGIFHAGSSAPNWITCARILLSRERRGQRGTEARRGRRLQFGVRDDEAHRGAHVADRRSAQRPPAGVDRGGAEESRRPTGSFVSRCCRRPRPAGRSRPAAPAEPMIRRPRRAAPSVPPRYNTIAHESPRRSGRRLAGGALPDRRAAGIRRLDRQLPADRADARAASRSSTTWARARAGSATS